MGHGRRNLYRPVNVAQKSSSQARKPCTSGDTNCWKVFRTRCSLPSANRSQPLLPTVSEQPEEDLPIVNQTSGPALDQNWKGCPTIICTPISSRERAKSIRPTRPVAWNRTPSPASHLRALDHGSNCQAGATLPASAKATNCIHWTPIRRWIQEKRSKAALGTSTNSHAVAATTVARRGAPVSREPSPNQSPGPSSATTSQNSPV